MKSFILSIILVSFPIYSMELDNEIEVFVSDQEISMLNLKKFLDSEDDCVFIEDLNLIANSLLYQDKFMHDLKQYIEDYNDKVSLERSIELLISKNFLFKDYLDKKALVSCKKITSPEALSLILQYPKVFKGLITNSKNDHIEDDQSVINNFLSFPKIDELCQKWKKSSNSEVSFLGKYISLHTSNAKQVSIKRKSLENLLNLKAEYFDIKGKYFFIQNYVALVEEDQLSKFFKFIYLVTQKLEEFFSEFDASIQNGACINLERDFVAEVSLFVEGYEKERLSLVSYYGQVVKELNSLINGIKDRKQKAKILKYKKKATSFTNILKPIRVSSVKVQCPYEIELNFEGFLPETLLRFNKNIVESVTVESESDDFNFLPDYLKKIEVKKKKPIKNNRRQKGKGKAQLAKKPTNEIPSKKEISSIGIKAEDESCIKEETVDYFLIEDSKNNLQSKILKSIEGSRVMLSKQNLQDIEMTQWVNDWYVNPKQAFKNQGYSSPGKKYNLNYDQVKAIHSPAKVIWDNLILKCGKQSTRQSRRVKGQQDILLTLPGVNYYDKDSSMQMGVFAYLIDAVSKQMYHVNFEPREGKKLMNDYLEKGYFEVEFPSLKDVYQ